MRRSPDRGSVLALIPAGFLVLILLAALAVDSAVTYLGQQQLHDTLAAAATDSATAALDNRAFYRGGALVLDPNQVARTTCLSVRAQIGSGLHDIHLAVAVVGDRVLVRGTADVTAVFGRAIPGFGRRRVSAQVAAVAAHAPLTAPGAASASFVPVSC